MKDAATQTTAPDLAQHFANVPDPRHSSFCDRHLLSDILVIAFCAVLSGCKSWEAIADFGLIRAHWGIENGCHWCLDVLFDQDRCRSRSGHAAQNLAWMRKMALALFRNDQAKGSVPTKQVRAALSDDYRSQLLNLLLQ